MPAAPPSIARSDVVRRLERLDIFDSPHETSDPSVTRIDGGVNDTFLVSLSGAAGTRLVVKFGTYSSPDDLRAGVAAYRLLDACTELPVPTVHATELDTDGGPPCIVMEHRAGTELAADFRDVPDVTDPDAVRVLGGVIDAFARIPDRAAEGYGSIRDHEFRAGGPCAIGAVDDFAEWATDYAGGFYADPPAHRALERSAPQALDYLRTNRDRIPATPPHSVVVTDLSPGNLLSPNATPPDDVDGLTGVVDLERAKLGPVEFTAVNAEYLLTRYVSDPAPVREALYDPLPFGPNVRRRDLYRLVAMARSVGALDAWYEPGSETHHRRGSEIAAEIRRLVE